MMTKKDISTLLESCLSWMDETGGTARDAAALHPEHQEELLELLQVAGQVSGIEIPAPSEEFAPVARTRMLNLIQASDKALTNPFVTKLLFKRLIGRTTNLTRRLSMTWIIVISLLATALAGGGGVAYAATESLPGDAFYPVKTALQDLQLTFASDEADVGILLDQMDETIEDLETLAQKGRWEDIEEGIDEYVEDFIEFGQLRARTNYDEMHPEDSISQRLQDQYMGLTNLQAKFRHSDKVQIKLQTAVQLTETGNTYGPNVDGGKPDATGESNGVGPAGADDNGNKPENAGSNKPEDAGNNNSGNGKGEGVQLNEKGCQVSETGEEICKPDDIGYICTENDEGELECINEHPEFGYGAYLCEKFGDGEILCKPEGPRDGHYGPAEPGYGPGNGPGNSPGNSTEP